MALQAMRRCRHRLVYGGPGDAGGGRSVVWTTDLTIKQHSVFCDSHFSRFNQRINSIMFVHLMFSIGPFAYLHIVSQKQPSNYVSQTNKLARLNNHFLTS